MKSDDTLFPSLSPDEARDARLRQHAIDVFTLIAAAPTPATAALGLSTLAQLMASRVWERPRIDAYGVLHAPTTFLAFCQHLAEGVAVAATGIIDPDLAGVEWLGGVVRHLGEAVTATANPAGREAVTTAFVIPLLRNIAAEAAAEKPHVGQFYAALARIPADAIAATARH